MFRKHYPYRMEIMNYYAEHFANDRPSRHKDITEMVFDKFGQYLEQNYVSLVLQEDVDYFMVACIYNQRIITKDDELRFLTRRLYDFVEYCHRNRNAILVGRLCGEKIARHVITFDGTETFIYDPLLETEDFLDGFKRIIQSISNTYISDIRLCLMVGL